MKELLNPTWTAAKRIPDWLLSLLIEPSPSFRRKRQCVMIENLMRRVNFIVLKILYKTIENNPGDLLFYFVIFTSESILCSFVAQFHCSLTEHSCTGKIWSSLLCDQGTQCETEADEGKKWKADNHQLTSDSTDQHGNNPGSSRVGCVITVTKYRSWNIPFQKKGCHQKRTKSSST